MGQRRQFSPEFKRDAVELVRSLGRPISAVARELGCGESSHAAPFLSAWIDLRGTTPGPLFCAIDRAGNLRAGRPLTGEAIRQLLQRRAAVAGLASVTPHDLRRSYAGDLLDAGADLPAVQQLLGHASPATTSRYDRRGDRARRAAAERLHLDLPAISDADGSEQP